MTRRAILIFAAVAPLTLAACASDTKTASAGPANAICPMGGEPVGADAQTVSFHGETVAFCCSGCKDKWEKLSDSEKSAKLAKAR